MSESKQPSLEDRVTRVDAPHPQRLKESGEVAAPLLAVAKIATGQPADAQTEQMRNQASQLARHLRDKQQQIDHREAQLNARIAQLEREVRASRLWCTDREQLSNERESELETEIEALQQKIRGFVASEVAANTDLEQQQETLQKHESEIAAREKRVGRERTQINAEIESLRIAGEELQAERLAHENRIVADEQELRNRELRWVEEQRTGQVVLARERSAHEQQAAQTEQRAEQLKQQRQAVDEQRQEEIAAIAQEQADALTEGVASLDEQTQCLLEERQEFERQRQAVDEHRQEEIAAAVRDRVDTLAEGFALLDDQTRCLQDERQDFEQRQEAKREQLRHDRESFEEQRRDAEQSVVALRTKLSGRQAALDQRRATMGRMRQQVLDVHRETIEMRMATEQLWQRLTQGNSVAELTQPLSSLRAQLVDEFQLARDERADQEKQLRELATKLDNRQQQLRQQRTELNQWLERRNTGVEEQAARLVARELELDMQERDLRDRQLAWRDERRELQTRLRPTTPLTVYQE